jgi:hypothetical protein
VAAGPGLIGLSRLMCEGHGFLEVTKVDPR